LLDYLKKTDNYICGISKEIKTHEDVKQNIECKPFVGYPYGEYWVEDKKEICNRCKCSSCIKNIDDGKNQDCKRCEICAGGEFMTNNCTDYKTFTIN
jgi:hypothetical protein